MKQVIHVITTISRGGAENQLIILTREQVKAGRKPVVIYLKDAPELLEEFEDAGVEVICFCSYLSFTRQVFWLKKYLKDKEVIIHAHLPRAEILVALASRKNRFFVTRHNAERFFPAAPKFISSFMSRLVTKRATKIIAISHEVARFLTKNREVSKETNVEIVYYGYDSNIKSKNSKKIDFRKELNIMENEIMVGTVGRIVKQKDYPTLLRSFAQFQNLNNKVKLVIVGEGILRKEMEILSQELRITEKVVWYGKTSRIFDFMNSIDLFVLTSVYEGFGLVLLEAMAAKVPIVTTKISAIPEVMGNKYKYLAEAGNASDFAVKMNSISSLGSVNRKKLKFYYEKRLKKFAPSSMSLQIENIYNEVLLDY